MKTAKHTYREKGFSLLELSVLLLVLGAVMAGFLQGYNVRLKQKQKEEQRYVAFTITDGMAKHLSRNGFYPCPAESIGIQDDDAEYGVATDCSDTSVGIGDCANGYCVTEQPAGSGIRIRVGAIPFRTIGVGKEDILDEYDNRYTYAVTETQAVAATYADNNGAISLRKKITEYVTDPGTGVTTTVISDTTDPTKDIIFFSHGEDGRGSYTSAGVANLPCAAVGTTLDAENCDGDGEFISASAGALDGAEHYDDNLISDLWEWVYVWDETISEVETIYNRNTNNMGIGTIDPQQKLHVANGSMRIKEGPTFVGGLLQNDELCNDSQGSCFPSSTLGAPDPGGILCPAGFVMIGIANGQPKCASALGNVNGGCGGFSFVTSFNFTSATQSVSVDCTNAITGGAPTTVTLN